MATYTINLGGPWAAGTSSDLNTVTTKVSYFEQNSDGDTLDIYNNDLKIDGISPAVGDVINIVLADYPDVDIKTLFGTSTRTLIRMYFEAVNIKLNGWPHFFINDNTVTAPEYQVNSNLFDVFKTNFINKKPMTISFTVNADSNSNYDDGLGVTINGVRTWEHTGSVFNSAVNAGSISKSDQYFLLNTASIMMIYTAVGKYNDYTYKDDDTVEITYLLGDTHSLIEGADYIGFSDKDALNADHSTFDLKKVDYPKTYDTIINRIKAEQPFTVKFKVSGTGTASLKLVSFDGLPLADIEAGNKILRINGKKVNSLSIGGHSFKSLEVGGHAYSLSNDVTTTEAEVEALVMKATSWTGGTATLSPETINGLDLKYSKDTGIADGEAVDVTVVFDATKVDSLNGGTVDVVYSGIVIANPDRTVTEAEVDDYATANIAWPGSAVTPTYEIKGSDYTTMSVSDPAHLSTVIIKDWTNSNPNKGVTMAEDETLLVEFNNDISLSSINQYSPIQFHKDGSVGKDYYQTGILLTTNPTEFKAGEKWVFQKGKQPVLYVPPVAFATLDITKWPALHPGTKLYTPDLHMVDGKEITLTVQADHGYTVNGGASVDYKYTPSSGPTADIVITEDDYTSLSSVISNSFIINGYKGVDEEARDTKSILLTFNIDHDFRSDNVVMTLNTYNGKILLVSFATSNSIDWPVKQGETWLFEPHKDPVKVS